MRQLEDLDEGVAEQRVAPDVSLVAQDLLPEGLDAKWGFKLRRAGPEDEVDAEPGRFLRGDRPPVGPGAVGVASEGGLLEGSQGLRGLADGHVVGTLSSLSRGAATSRAEGGIEPPARCTVKMAKLFIT